MNNSIVFVNISKRRNSSELCLIPVHDIAEEEANLEKVSNTIELIKTLILDVK